MTRAPVCGYYRKHLWRGGLYCNRCGITRADADFASKRRVAPLRARLPRAPAVCGYYRRHLWRGGEQCLRCGAVKSLRDERAFRENLLDYLLTWQARGHGVVIDIRHPRPSAPGREGGVSRTPGAPDLLVFREHRQEWSQQTGDSRPVVWTFRVFQALALELKVGSGQQSEPQREWQRLFEAQGGIYRVQRQESEIDAIFAELGWPTVEVPR